MRGLAVLLIGLTLLGGCATVSRPAAARADEASAAPRRCSTADPDRWAWFCVVGQILYGAASFFQPVNELSMR
ncbi:MAG TPA: hypothetical protein VGA90_15805 [Methylomirabilota bacterium]